MLLRVSKVTRLRSTAGPHVTPAVTAVCPTNEKNKRSFLPLLPSGIREGYWRQCQNDYRVLKAFVMLKPDKCLQFQSTFFERLTSETEIFNSTVRTQSLPKQFNSFYSFSKMVAICVTGGVVEKKNVGEFFCYSSDCFVVFACRLLQRQFSKI